MTAKEIIARARAEIRALCIGRAHPAGRDWTMCVPVQDTDSDVVLLAAIELAEKADDGESDYELVRDAIDENFIEFLQGDDVAEVAILIAGIEEAGREIARLRLQVHEATRTDTTTDRTTRAVEGGADNIHPQELGA